MASFFTLHYAWLIAFVLSAWGYGRLAMGGRWFSSRLESVVFRFGVGAALLSGLVFVLGLAGFLTRPFLLAILAGGLLGALSRGAHFPRLPPIGRPVRVAGVLLALVLSTPVLLQPLYPPVDWDATSYHLAAANLYLKAHALAVTTYLRYPVFPQLQEMLFTLALGLVDDVAAHLVSFSLWIGCATIVFALGRRLGDRHAAILATALWIGGPTGMTSGSIGYVDIGLAFFVGAAVLAWVAFAQEGRRRWVALSGALAGCAAATKYSGLFFAGALAVATLAYAKRGTRVRATALFLAMAAVPALPWYLRNAIVSGDPLFPFLGRWLANRFWNADDLHRQIGNLRSTGAGRSEWDALRLWDRLAFNQGLFVGPERVFSPALWIPLPVLLIARWRRPIERVLLILTSAYFVIWFLFAQEGRYLLPAVLILCLSMGLLLSAGLARLPGAGAPRASALVWVLAGLLALPTLWYARDRTAARGLPPVQEADRASFLEANTPSYPAYAWLNRTRGARYRVYGWRDERMAYFSDGDFLGDWFGPARFARIESALPDGAAVYRELEAMGVDYFLVPSALGPVQIPTDPPFSSHVALVRAWPGVRLYAVDRSPGQPPPD